jgi:hypothetical protein
MPAHEHPQDHVSMLFVLRVNCPGEGAALSLRLDSEHSNGDQENGGEWWGPEHLDGLGDEVFWQNIQDVSSS